MTNKLSNLGTKITTAITVYSNPPKIVLTINYDDPLNCHCHFRPEKKIINETELQRSVSEFVFGISFRKLRILFRLFQFNFVGYESDRIVFRIRVG